MLPGTMSMRYLYKRIVCEREPTVPVGREEQNSATELSPSSNERI